jgi:pimeloyl-ACP methyl ester carboxylesterase
MPHLIRLLGKWLLIAGSLLVVIPLALFTGCQSNFIYFPRSYPPGVARKWAADTHGKLLDFTTSQGPQRAFLLGELAQPRHLWLVCGGNGTVALEWSPWLRAHAPQNDAWLLVDFPGYGDCQGSPNPARIRETLAKVVPLAAAELGWSLPRDTAKLRFFGHSLGGAACLIAATDLSIQQGVLLAPFTSTMDMTREVIGVPLGFLVWHRYDNTARLAEIAARGSGKVVILHGTQDEVIPVTMSRTLAARYPQLITLREIPNGHHNDIPELAPAALAAALREVAE